MSNEGPYRENQKPTDTWRMRVCLRMRSGAEHVYAVHGIPGVDRKRTFRDEQMRFLYEGYQRQMEFQTDPCHDSVNDSGCGSRVVDISPEVTVSEQVKATFIRVSEIESLDIQMFNERVEREETVEKLRQQRQDAANRRTKLDFG